MVITGKVTGLKALDATLIALAKEYNDPKLAIKTLRPAVKKATDQLLEDIRALTPVKTGTLVSLLRRQIKKPSNKELSFNQKDIVIAGLIGFKARNFKFLVNAYVQEYGNRKTPAKMMLRKSLIKNEALIVSTYKRELKISIEKVTKRLRNKHKNKG